jgi:hypothetical protein
MGGPGKWRTTTNEARIAQLYADRRTKRDEAIADLADALVDGREQKVQSQWVIDALCEALDERERGDRDTGIGARG